MANTSLERLRRAARARAAACAPISQVLEHGERREHLAAFGDLADAEVADAVRLERRDVVVPESDAARRAARSMPAMVRMSDDLPAPFAPTMATISPCGTSSETPVERLRVAVVEVEVRGHVEHQTSSPASSPR